MFYRIGIKGDWLKMIKMSINRILILAVLVSMIFPLHAASAQISGTYFYSIDGQDGDTSLNLIDSTNGALLATGQIILDGVLLDTDGQGTGLAFDSTTDTFYGAIIPDLNSQGDRVLATINPITYQATQVGTSFINDGSSNLKIADLAIGSDGKIIGTTGGFQGSTQQPSHETLYEISTVDASATKICQMPTPPPSGNSFGETIAINGDYLYRISGERNTETGDNPILYKVDLATSKSNPDTDPCVIDSFVVLTFPGGAQLFPDGSEEGEHFNALTYDDSQNLLLGSGGFDPFPLYSITDAGVVTEIDDDLGRPSGDLAFVEIGGGGGGEPIAGNVITEDSTFNLKIQNGETWTITNGATFTGNIKVIDGTLVLEDGCTVFGNIRSEGANSVSINSCTVTGHVRTDGGTLEITNSIVKGNVNAKNANGVTITSNPETFERNLRVEGSIDVTITGNSVTENLRIKTSSNVVVDDNSANNIRLKTNYNVDVNQNTALHNMQINGNDEIVITDNHADNNLNVKKNTHCSHSGNTAENKLNIKHCEEILPE